MFAYDNLVQWCKDMRSAQIARRNRAWRGLNPIARVRRDDVQ